ncbi:MAG: hypothetical protein GY820_38475 [Gammaproteobacteria bacterium]|nr:hypothetical protein [Gammaproteobacteria bacterium]
MRKVSLKFTGYVIATVANLIVCGIALTKGDPMQISAIAQTFTLAQAGLSGAFFGLRAWEQTARTKGQG